MVERKGKPSWLASQTTSRREESCDSKLLREKRERERKEKERER
jgi:hypothetical protein